MRVFRYLVCAAIAILLAGCGEDPLSASVTVRYEVTGSAESVNIDYLDSNGDLAIVNGQGVPWEITFSANKGDQVYLSAKRTGETGTVTVKIYKDGTLLDEDTSTDSSAATAEGTL